MSKVRTQRIKIVLGLIYLVVFLVVGKLAYVQLIDGKDMEAKALNNRLKEIELKANRGVICDRNGNQLAISIATTSIYLNPATIRRSKTAETTIQKLAEILEMDQGKVQELVNKNTQFVWLKRHAPDEQVQALKELDLTGVGFSPEYKRSYPKGTLASHIIGFAGVDNQGLNGLEMKYERELKGTPGKLLMEYDNINNEVPQAMKDYIPAEPGYNLHLTIDETIQYILERELQKVYQEQEAKQATAIVMDVKTGDILAMANLPNFDPNDYGAVDPKIWNNFAVSGLYEPGSTFKIMSASMFLDEGVTRPEDHYYCAGAMKIGNDPHLFRCHVYPKSHGNQTFSQAVGNSCNPVMAQMVAKMGGEAFYDYLGGFGFREKTGIDIPGEAIGLTVKQDKATARDYASMAIGQANAFTPIQMITAISAVANGGYLMTPHVVKQITDVNGKVIEDITPNVVRQVISEQTAREMWQILEQVVTSGTGKKGQIEGYQIAGKTGTAQKVDSATGTYSASKSIVSFAGFAPANDPQIACIVIVDEPKNGTGGGLVAGPVFSSIVEDTLRYLNVPKTVIIEQPEKKTVEQVVIPEVGQGNAAEIIEQFVAAGFNPIVQSQGDTMYAYLPPAGTTVDAGSDILLYCKDAAATAIPVPDLTGKTIKEVDRILSGLGFKVIIQGSGVAQQQEPAAGTVLDAGQSVVVTFSTAMQPPSDAENATKKKGNQAPVKLPDS